MPLSRPSLRPGQFQVRPQSLSPDRRLPIGEYPPAEPIISNVELEVPARPGATALRLNQLTPQHTAPTFPPPFRRARENGIEHAEVSARAKRLSDVERPSEHVPRPPARRLDRDRACPGRCNIIFTNPGATGQAYGACTADAHFSPDFVSGRNMWRRGQRLGRRHR